MSGKRNNQRVELRIRIASKDDHISGYTKNLSTGGCFIENSENFCFLPIGNKIPFYLEIPGDYAYMEIEGVVKHHGKEGDGMGIYFETTNKGITFLIDHFLRNYSQK